MTITYAYFRGNRSYNKGRLSKVHASSGGPYFYPICSTIINKLGSDKIYITQDDIQIDNLCKKCQDDLIKRGIRWFIKPSDDFIHTDIKGTNSTDNSRGDSLEINISRERTEKITYNLGDYTLTITMFGGEFSSAVLRENKIQRTISILSDVNLVKLFMLLYRAVYGLGVLSDEISESIEQFIFDNKNK